jgi:O-antigen ligase
LFILSEQGVIGFLLFIIVVVIVLIRGQKIYHETIDAAERAIVMGLLISFVVVLFDNMLSDLMEAVKVGPFFYWIIALLVIQDLKNKNHQTAAVTSPTLT